MHKHLTKIIVAIIVAISAIVVAYIQFRKPSNNPQPTTIEYVGRVIDKDSKQPIRDAKVTFEFQGAPPIVHTDSEGIFSIPVIFTGVNIRARVRVEFEGYVDFDRNINLTTEKNLEDIRLTKKPVNPPKPTGGVPPVNESRTDSPNKNQTQVQDVVIERFPLEIISDANLVGTKIFIDEETVPKHIIQTYYSSIDLVKGRHKLKAINRSGQVTFQIDIPKDKTIYLHVNSFHPIGRKN